MSQPKVAEDVARAEFARMCVANRVEQDESELTADELKEWVELRGKIVADICRGALVIDAEGRPTYTPESGKAVTFQPATGASLMALETHGKGKEISNTVAAMADMTGTNKGDFSRMSARDFRACMRLTNLFLADQ